MILRRRDFLQQVGAVFCLALVPATATARLAATPVARNLLRPPGAVVEEIFPGKCIRCGRCVEVCPYRSIFMLDIRHGLHAGTPLIDATKIPCYLCMKCVEVCPTGSLRRVRQNETRMGLAVVNRFLCAAWIGTTLCRTCYDKCPFADHAIRLDQLRPMINEAECTGCGICTHACPVTGDDGSKAINIEPLQAVEKVSG